MRSVRFVSPEQGAHERVFCEGEASGVLRPARRLALAHIRLFAGISFASTAHAAEFFVPRPVGVIFADPTNPKADRTVFHLPSKERAAPAPKIAGISARHPVTLPIPCGRHWPNSRPYRLASEADPCPRRALRSST